MLTYDVLRFTERDKFRGDEMRIDWTTSSLLDVALIRAQASVGRSLASEELWDVLFPSSFAHTATPHYLVSRTLGRPRDLIQFANLCRDTAEKNGRPAVTGKDITEAEVQFSQWKLQDLAREYEINYPFLADLFILFQNSSYIMRLIQLAAKKYKAITVEMVVANVASGRR